MKRLLILFCLLPLISLGQPPPTSTVNSRPVEVNANGDVVTTLLPGGKANYAAGTLEVSNEDVVAIDNLTDITTRKFSDLQNRPHRNLGHSSSSGAQQTTGLMRPLLAPAVTIANDSTYNSFPSMCIDPSGRMHVFYRSGSDHLTARDGILKYAVSADNGATWTTVTHSAATGDKRDPHVLMTRSGLMVLVYNIYVVGTAINNGYIQTSSDYGATWSAAALIPAAFALRTYPLFSYQNAVNWILESKNGEILVSSFGFIGSADTRYSSKLLRSADNGLTWSAATIATAPSTNSYNEVQVFYDRKDALVALVRDEETNKLWRTVSTDDGLTWGALADVTPASWYPSHPDLAIINGVGNMLYRGPGFANTRRAVTYDEGVTWSTTANELSQTYMYSSSLSDENRIICALAYENSAGDSDVILTSYRLGAAHGLRGGETAEQFISERSYGSDNPAFVLSNPSLVLPATGLTWLNAKDVSSATVHAFLGPTAAVSGGAGLVGFTTDTAGAFPLFHTGIHGSASPTAPATVLRGGKISGGAVVALAAGEKLFELRNWATTVATVYGDGDLSLTGALTLGDDLAVTEGGTGASTAADARTNLGLGTAAVANTGTSGANVPLLNGTNTWGGDNTFGNLIANTLLQAGNASTQGAVSIATGTGANNGTVITTGATVGRAVTFPDAAGAIVLDSATQTLTNKTLNLTSNTLVTTLAQLNTAVSDADLASLAGTESLTNKSYSGTDLTLTGASLVSDPVVHLTGAVFTGGSATTTKPHILVEPTGATSNNWSASGTMLGLNAASGFVGDLIVAGVNMSRAFAVGPTGGVTLGSMRLGGDVLTINTLAVGLVNRDTGDLAWTSSSNAQSGTIDTKISRNAAGIVEVNSGTEGTFRDILARAHIHGGVTVANLPGSPVAGSVAYVTDGSATPAWGDTVTGGGSTKILVWWNGTAWTAIGK